ncbi:MAG: hypothetical protein ACFE0P_06140 [Oceanicaulis sp.]
MVPIRGYAGTRIMVLGLEGPGPAAARAFIAGGAEVTVWDDDEARRADASAAGLTVEDPTGRDWGDLAALVVEEAELIDAEEPPRLIELARSLGAPVLAARCVLVEAAARDPGVKLALITGRHAGAAAHLAAHLLQAAGLDAEELGAAATPAPGGWVIAALDALELAHLSDIVEAEAFAALSSARPCAPAVLDRLADAACAALIAGADDRACARLIAARRGPHAAAVSGRQVLGGGVYAAGMTVFDALDGRARRAGVLPRCAPREAVAAGYALARRLGVSADTAAAALADWPGAPGCGRIVARFGPAPVIDWNAATTPASALDALSGAGPVVWIAGPSLPAHAGALLEASGADVRAVHLVTDRARAAKGISNAAPCTVHRDLAAALARGVHDALRRGADGCALVYAPGSLSGQTGEAFDAAACALLARALRGDAA